MIFWKKPIGDQVLCTSAVALWWKNLPDDIHGKKAQPYDSFRFHGFLGEYSWFDESTHHHQGSVLVSLVRGTGRTTREYIRRLVNTVNDLYRSVTLDILGFLRKKIIEQFFKTSFQYLF